MPFPKAYLAGPAVFHPAAKQVLQYLKDVCRDHGIEGVTPVDAPKEGSPAERAASIRSGNIALIGVCDMVIACVSPFRGPGADAGTAWEMGYAEALGKPVVPWREDAEDYLARVPHDRDDTGLAWCRQHGMLVEDFGLSDNLMLTAGAIAVQPSFDAAVRLAAKLCGC